MAEEGQETHKGFLSDVSPLKISKSNTQYFNAVFQTEHRVYKVVAFVPDKHQICLDADQKASPIKIRNFRYVSARSGTGLDIQINKSTSIELIKSVDFKKKLNYDEAAGPGTDRQKPTIANIANIDSNKANVMYSIQGKILELSDQEEILIYGAKKLKMNVVLADHTAKVTISLFEDFIKKVRQYGSYRITNLSSRLFRNYFYLTSTSRTEITEVHDVAEVAEVSDVFLAPCITTLQGPIVQVQCTEKLKCPSCDKNVDVHDDAIIVKCNFCKLKAKVSSVKKTYFFRINIQETAVHRLICFHTAMEEFLKSSGKLELLKDMDQLEDFLLSLDKVTVTITKDSDIISSIQLA